VEQTNKKRRVHRPSSSTRLVLFPIYSFFITTVIIIVLQPSGTMHLENRTACFYSSNVCRKTLERLLTRRSKPTRIDLGMRLPGGQAPNP
jgi:hypothetical protein